jgi:hypothetical protein
MRFLLQFAPTIQMLPVPNSVIPVMVAGKDIECSGASLNHMEGCGHGIK